MKKKIIVGLSLLLTVLLTFSACSFQGLYDLLDPVMHWSEMREQEWAHPDGNNTQGDMPKFSDIEYVRPDMDEIEASFGETIDYLGSSDLKEETALDKVSACYDLYCDFYTMQTVAELRYYHDITDNHYADESDWCLDQEARMDQLYDQLCVAGANSAAGAYLEENFFGEGFVANYGGEAGGTMDDEFVALARRENSILTEYRRTVANVTVEWKGSEQPYWDLMSDPYLTEEDHAALQALYYDKYSHVLGELYLQLVGVRQELAAYLGFDSYEEYAYLADYDRDFTPEQTQEMLGSIKTELVPLYEELQVNDRWAEHSYSPITEAQITQILSDAAMEMGGTIRSAFKDLKRYELWDISISDNKGDVSYQTYLYSYDNPYIIVKTYGYDDDLLSVGHEFGHFVDAWYNWNGTDSIDLAEVFSQGMEYLLLSRVPEKYREGLTEYKLLDTLDTFTQQGSFAAFEHEVYARPAAEWTPEELNDLSLRLAEEYGYLVPGQEDYYAKSWIDITHFFENPFYVISYVVSDEAAFQIYERECQEEGKGLELWNKLLPRDYDGFLDTLLLQGEMENPLEADRMKNVAELLRQKLE